MASQTTAMFRARGSGGVDAKGALALQGLFGAVTNGANGVAREEDSGEPARKRQRREERPEAAHHTTPGRGSENVALLASLEIEFIPPTNHIHDAGDEEIVEVKIATVAPQIDIDLEQNHRDQTTNLPPSELRATDFARDAIDGSAKSYLVNLVPVDSRIPIPGFSVTHAKFQDIAECLSWAKMLGQPRKPKQAFDPDTIAWTKCTIVYDRQKSCYRLHVDILWRTNLQITHVMNNVAAINRRLSMLERFIPKAGKRETGKWSTVDFYKSVYVPPMEQEVAKETQSESVLCRLYPFQKRAVNWMLGRERVMFKDGNLVDSDARHNSPSFEAVETSDGRKLYVSHFLGMITEDSNVAQSSLRGGILAEEMGLGKTVELITLVALHKRKIALETLLDPYSGEHVTTSGATLIITPPNLTDQWLGELENHAPDLKVIRYYGIANHSRFDSDMIMKELLAADVVVTNYHVLSREIHFAKKVRDHGLRASSKVYERKRSPLVQISWWRVILDEAQMIESGVSQAAEVVRLIPRVNAWAVSGTPVKKDVQDLFGLLIFLRYEPFVSAAKLWPQIPLPIFRDIFGQIALRHSKDKVRSELRLPPQRRLVITVPFTAVEEQVYKNLFDEMCHSCGFNADGSPKSDDFNPDSPALVSHMRSWLVRLRQTCLHPQVGGRNRRALGRRNGPLRTVAEVLEVMIEQNETGTRDAERSLVMSIVNQGHIFAFDGSTKQKERATTALEHFQTALAMTQGYVDDLRAQVAEEATRIGVSADDSAVKKETGTPDGEPDDDADAGDGGLQSRLQALRLALRLMLGLVHVCLFFVATSYFQMKSDEEAVEPGSDEFHQLEKLEIEFYDKAKAVRKEMLQEPHAKAHSAIQRIATKQKEKKLAAIPVVANVPSRGGIENRQILEKVDVLQDLLNHQAEQLEKWRDEVIRILLLPLVDSDDETTGEEYEDSTKAQDKLYVYLAVLRAVVADRFHVLTGQQNLLVDIEMKEAVRRAKQDDPEGHAPELLLELAPMRDRLRLHAQDVSLRSVISELRTLSLSLTGSTTRAEVEARIVEQQLSDIQAISSAQLKAVNLLERELHVYTTCMNLRVEYYRQLQRISDTVAPWQEELDEFLNFTKLEECRVEGEQANEKLATLKSKHRFLLHLRNESDGKQERDCVICQQPIENGVLTVCGHLYDSECIKIWYRQHKSCPMCKRQLRLADFHAVAYKPKEIQAQEEQHDPDSPERTKSSQADKRRQSATIYTSIAQTTLDAIKNIDLSGSYGTKVDTIARHLLYLREADPGSKSIIFSQYGDFLEVLERAFRQFKIGVTSISAKGGIEKFRKDAATEVFLLDAKSDSSGLNLINATHVFLCEPLINTALELQAIARVHRIGQQRTTHVYQYLISDTVEEAIYDISLARRLAHVAKTHVMTNNNDDGGHSGSITPLLQESALDAANSLELQQAPLSDLLTKGKKGQSEGERVEKKDLWGCLFSKSRIGDVVGSIGAERRAGEEGVGKVLHQEVQRHLRVEAAENRIRRRADGEE